MVEFVNDLARELARSRFNNYADNFDRILQKLLQTKEPPPQPPLWRECASEPGTRLGEFGSDVKPGLGKLGQQIVKSIRPFARPIERAFSYYFLPVRFFRPYAKQYECISFLYILLGNPSSRNLLVKLFAYRILGHRKVKLPRNCTKYWSDIENIEKYRTDVAPITIKFMDFSLGQFDFKHLGYNLKVYATGPGSACTFVQQQYEYHHDHVHCKAEPGDIAIDAGACWGETTMYFAHEVGPDGKVVSFEFISSNLAVMNANLRANPELAKRVVLMENPVWSHSGLRLYYVDWGPGSRITEDEKQYKYDGTCETITIDDVVAQKKLPRVDFIKMDIEGAEFRALQGAEQTIRKYRPKLAISLYHQLSDFVTIPRWLHGLELSYDFYLDHHTIYENETVLFAVPRKDAAAGTAPGMASEAA